ncbi:proteophosphoglycan ppg4 [Rhodotorula toruloides]|uniref:Proteophosphoglycan ppg4 n=1 Tax=Rhodotorula toruloides TaxID=5286 RepID=A0A511KE51_RHOTO|nr:proteophosphoglycan ppg4 [Rhodotorula toruloides]
MSAVSATEPRDGRFEGLLALRERLTRDEKRAKSRRQGKEADEGIGAGQRPLDYAAAFETVLPFCSSTSTAVSSAVHKGSNPLVPTTTAFETLDNLLQRAHAILTARAYPEELDAVRSQLSPDFLVYLSSTLYATWHKQLPSALQKLKASLETLFAIASPACLDVQDVSKQLKEKVLVDALDSRRVLSTFEALIPHLAVEDFAAFAESSTGMQDIAAGVLRRFIRTIAMNDEQAQLVGKTALSWIEKCWATREVEGNAFVIEPCLEACRTDSPKLRHSVTTYILQGAFSRRKELFVEMLRAGGYLFTDEAARDTPDADLEAALAIFKTGNALNLVDLDASVDAEPSKKVPLPSGLLRSCLWHSSTSLRTSALSVLVLAQSPAVPFPLSCFPLLRDFYQYSLSEEDAEFRMSTTSLTGKLLLRLRDSSWKAQCTADKGKDGASAAAEYVCAAKSFLKWFLNLVGRENLNPARPFRLKITSLRLLDLALQAHVDPRFHIEDQANAGDGEQGNGRDATNGFSSYRKTAKTQTPTFHAKHRKMDRNDHLHASDSSTTPARHSAWPFDVEVVTPETTQTLLRQLLSTYTAIRYLAVSMLERFPSPLPGYEGEEGTARAKEQLLQPALRMIRSGREAEASAGAGVIGLVWRKWILEAIESGGSAIDHGLTLGPVGGWLEGADTESGPAGYAYVSSLLDLADQQLSQYSVNLATAASRTPMHGTILALRHLFVSVPAASYSTLSPADDRRQIFHRTLGVIKRVWDVTSPVLAAKAPEGAGADDADTEEARAIRFERQALAGNGEDKSEAAEGTGGTQHKIILSACWRAMKEAGELLETILRIPSELDADAFRQIWHFDEIEAIGDLFGTWLRLARHRGTVANLHPCFSRSAAALLVSGKRWQEVGELPGQWLKEYLDAIVSARISITRRSAAIPFVILGLMLAILPTSRQTFDAALVRLFEIAESTKSDITDESRTHAMNTLRTIFLDAKGGVAAQQYVERGFHLSIRLFWSPNWILRNVAMMLFGSLINRAINSRRANLDRDPVSLSKRVSIDDFFARYPSLQPVLQEELERGWRESASLPPSSNLQSSLFAILMLFSLLRTPKRLSTQSDAGKPTSPSTAFVPLVEACLASRVWKIRNVAADALTGLVAPDDVSDTCLAILIEMRQSVSTVSLNELHGQLLRVLRLVEVYPLAPADEKRVSNAFVDLLPTFIGTSRSPPTVLSTYFTIALHLRSSLPHVSTAAFDFVQQSEAGSAESRRNDEQAALVIGALAGSSLETKRAALTHLETGPGQLLQRTSTALYRFVLDPSQAGDVRVQASTLLHAVSSSSFTADFEEVIVANSETPIVPLREALLPVVASAARTEDQRTQALRLLEQASGVNESVESREAAGSALICFAKLHNSLDALPASLRPRFALLASRLLQDDDVTVREYASEACGLRYVEGKAVEQVVTDGGEPLRQLLLEEEERDFETDLALISNPSSLLFAVEKPNIFRDFALATSLLLPYFSSASSPNMKAHVRMQTAKLAEAVAANPSLPAGPLGLTGNELVSRWANTLIRRLDTMGEAEDEAILRLRPSL